MENEGTDLRLHRAAELAVDGVNAIGIGLKLLVLSNTLRSDLREVGFDEIHHLRREARSLSDAIA